MKSSKWSTKGLIASFACISLASCGGGNTSESTTQTPSALADANTSTATGPTDSTLTPGTGQVISRLLDTNVEGLTYESKSGAGTIFAGKTTAQGDFVTYAGGSTSFKIGNVEIGSWFEPISASVGGGRKTLVQLSDLSYGLTTCSVTSPTDAARILLSLNSSPNQYYMRIPSGTSLQGCPNDSNFFVLNKVTTTAAVADAHLNTTYTYTDALKRIAASLFSIPIADIDDTKNSLGVDYSYNGYGAPWDAEDGNCMGYDGGHAGVDFQTSDAKGTKTAERDVHSVTPGQVVGVDSANGRVVVKTQLTINSKLEDVYVGYLHMRSIPVKIDDTVTAGQKLGVQGNLGLGKKSTDTNSAEHVHIEINSSKPSSLARCGANPKSPKIGSVDPDSYFRAISGNLTSKWLATMVNHGVTQKLEFSNNLVDSVFAARGSETFISGTCTLTSALEVSGTRSVGNITIRTTTTTSRKTCPDGTYSGDAGFIRNYSGTLSGNIISIKSVDQCDFSWSSPTGCFKFSEFKKQ